MGQLTLITIFVTIFYVFSQGVFAQTSESTDSSETATQTETPSQVSNSPQTQPNYPVIDNKGIVHPTENINPFGMSTLGSSTDSGFRKDTSTLSNNTRRRSNLEVNKPREKKVLEETQEETDLEETTFDTGMEEPIEEPVEPAPSLSSGRSGNLYRWVDKNGVLHVTNDIGSIPAEYRQQVVSEPQSDGINP
ncbi:MAG TPA: hypothetical protein VLB01_07235 [Thermodesulfobacteriota bacterium]|nr:hypothetical protein [Thermodesulfobacteriota bacterium]